MHRPAGRQVHLCPVAPVAGRNALKTVAGAVLVRRPGMPVGVALVGCAGSQKVQHDHQRTLLRRRQTRSNSASNAGAARCAVWRCRGVPIRVARPDAGSTGLDTPQPASRTTSRTRQLSPAGQPDPDLTTRSLPSRNCDPACRAPAGAIVSDREWRRGARSAATIADSCAGLRPHGGWATRHSVRLAAHRAFLPVARSRILKR
jgi:hypothetical protein